MAHAPCCVWDFTLKEKYSDVETLKEMLEENCKKWCFQLEQGSTGYKHYQGRFSLKLKARITGVIKLFGNAFHFSITSNENRDNNFYVTKEEGRIDGPWSNEDEKIIIPFHLKNKTLWPWQQKIANDCKELYERIINVIVDTEGKIGKSILSSWIMANKLGMCLPPLNHYKDLMQFVCSTDISRLYIIDMPRGHNQKELNSFWGGIETLKNGQAFDTRYKGRYKIFDPPSIWVFMNTEPDKELLTKDRWKFWGVSEEKELIQYY